jgi:adenosylcobinamide kinase/adenosylcobinamide-phosphate guanylyltransferase
MKQLILGGVRSGKSRLAGQVALDSGLAVTYVATALSGDAEMQQRITRHRQCRPDDWTVLEAPYALAGCLKEQAGIDICLLVDCLTAWLSNLLCAEDDIRFEQEMAALLEVLPTLPGQIILVSNETSMGIIPLGELTRRFCDEAGLLHQTLARQCDRVVLSVAGLPHVLKDELKAGLKEIYR